MKTAAILFLFAVSVALASLRILGERHIAFQAVAHIWLGLLNGGFVALLSVRNCLYLDKARSARNWAFLLLALALMLSAVEIACFFLLPR